VLFEAADAAHPQVVQAIIPGIRDGMLTDMRGRRIYFSDAVVILAGSHDTSVSNRSIGFHQPGQAPAADAGAAAVEGLEQLEDFADFVLLRPEATSAGTSRSGVEGNLLSVIADRHRERGIELQWDPTVLDWLGAVYESNRDERRLEKLVEREIGPVLIRALRGVVGVKAPRYVVRRVGSEVVIEVIGESAGH
jgi:ATP-dependent Clp protease ATP-binding subunit ClpA